MSQSYETDVLIIGTGPGGSTAGHVLRSKGREVLFIEEGSLWNPRHDGAKTTFNSIQDHYRNGGASPAFSKPIWNIAEGKCVGGGSLINGGLIWRTPSMVLQDWKKQTGIEYFSKEVLSSSFEYIEDRLNVSLSNFTEEGNLDSKLLIKGCTKLNWKISPVPRALKKCKQSNMCPIGCPTGAKISMIESFLLDFKDRIISNCRAVKIKPKNNTVIAVIRGSNKKKVKVKIKYNELIVSAGALQTPLLLHKSGLINDNIKLSFHLNLKIIANFEDSIHSDKGTMFTAQVQEFEKQGMLFMGTNYNKPILGAATSIFPLEIRREILEQYNKNAIYTSMIRPKGHAKIKASKFLDFPFVFNQFTREDINLMKQSLIKLSELLFEAGAKKLYLPISNSSSISNLEDAYKKIDECDISELSLSAMHIMSSCAIGTITDKWGRLPGTTNISIADASLLPSNTGESPQGTIMALIHHIMNHRSEL